MSASKKLEMFPDELYLQTALKDGRATRQELSMKALGKPDTHLQARERHLDVSHVQMLHEILRQQGQLAPVIVFRELLDGKERLHLADGFHRHEVYRREGLTGIPAFVIKGKYHDAIEYATMCNRRLCLPRRKEDIRKAIFMILEQPDWFNRPAKTIGDHVGISHGSVEKYRVEFCSIHKVDPPDRVINFKGQSFPRVKSSSGNVLKERVDKRGYSEFTAVIEGKQYYVGRNRTNVDSRVSEIIDAVAEKKNNIVSAIDYICKRIPFKTVTGCRGAREYPGVKAYSTPGCIVSVCDFSVDGSFARATHSLIAARRLTEQPEARLVVICYAEDGPTWLIEVFKQEGFEFLTPDELVISLKQPK